MRHLHNLVPGAQDSGEALEIASPYDFSTIGIADLANEAAVEQALAIADELFRDRHRWLPLPERLAILEKTAIIMRDEFDRLVTDAVREGGKPLQDSRIEVNRAIDGVRLCVETMRTTAGSVIPMGINESSAHRLAFTTLEPIGPVAAVSAFNHPLNLIVHQVAPAVAAGCPAIVKPAGKTPISCFNFVEILHRAGLLEEWCQALVISDRQLATYLATNTRIGFLSFIGSSRVGWLLRSRLEPGTRCALEHGGVAPVILAPDADMDVALPKILKGGFYHAGQVCVSVQRVYVQRGSARLFAERLAEAATKLKVGDPLLADTDVGPLIDVNEVDRVEEWVREAERSGAEVLCGGEKKANNCYSCTVLFNPPDDVRVSTREVFGPVVCIYEYDELDEAIHRANRLPVSFQAALFTKNIDIAMHVYRRLNGSAVMVNDHTAFRVDWMPFAGLQDSGYGTGGIPHTIRDMQIEKMLVINSDAL
jgi:acyl-CoA reductase-like NAD-dependent aldehyde dehydrogenase